jgi:hypothetical protein
MLGMQDDPASFAKGASQGFGMRQALHEIKRAL